MCAAIATTCMFSLSLNVTVCCHYMQAMESQDEAMHGRVQKVMDLISVVHAFREMQV